MSAAEQQPTPAPDQATRHDGQKIAVLGAGSWGTTFAAVLADAATEAAQQNQGQDGVAHTPVKEVAMWARRAELAEEINTTRRNERYTGQRQLPELITASSDLAACLHGATVVVLAIPAQALAEYVPLIKTQLGPNSIVVSLIKGLQRNTRRRMSEVIAEDFAVPQERIVVVSGPNLAAEIARKEPTASVVASVAESSAQEIVRLCSTSYFRPYTNTDVVGVEIGGVVKNVIALAVGMCDGQNLGDNSKASVITRGLAETTRLALTLGGHPQTLAGLAGLGDLVATCASPLSRNRTAGRMLGQGKTVEAIQEEMQQVAEGIKSARAVTELARSQKVEMPICEAVVRVLEEDLIVKDMAALLLSRDLKAEVKP